MAGTDHLTWRRVLAAATLAGAGALLTGCFGGGSTTVVQGGNVPQGLSATMTPKGPSDIADNLAWLISKNQKQLQDFHADCPDEPTPPNYPVNCTMTAIDTSKISKRNLPDGEHRPVSGTATVLGVYPGTQTYSYQLNYQPKFTQKPGFKPKSSSKK